MYDYFEKEKGIAESIGTDIKPVVKTIADRYIKDNPEIPVVYRICSTKAFHSTNDYINEVKLHEKFPNMIDETYAYAWGVVKASAEGNYGFRFAAYGPVFVYVNGEYAYRSGLYQERFSDALANMNLKLNKGDNSIVFLCVKTPLGCGFRIGSGTYKGLRVPFYSPTEERKGMSGFVYSEPIDKPFENVPKLYQSEAQIPLKLYPDLSWSKEEENLSPIQRIYHKKQGIYLAASSFEISDSCDCTFTGHADGNGELFIDGEAVGRLEKKFHISLPMEKGKHIVVVKSEDFSLQLDKADLAAPVNMDGTLQPAWLYIGPFAKGQSIPVDEVFSFNKPLKSLHGDIFWRVDLPDCYLRVYNESPNFGEWNYPLGVTLYGMMQSARLLKDEKLMEYIGNHLKQSTDYFDYCIWDKEQFGAASFHHLLTTIDSLDDCGSFASMMLEYMKDHDLTEGRKIADFVANYILNKQLRMEDGTFYRDHAFIKIMDKTMWADDMYMSIPFLSRYYALTKDEAYLNDAVLQVKNFKKYLYMPEYKIMSHIYDVHYKLQTKVPWGRGNGWVLFSITELLVVMPKEHPEYNDIIEIYRDLCEGYLKVQGEEGMWRQVLTFPDSYKETSCTAMFIYSFCRGVRYGWLKDSAPYVEAAIKGWKAICSISVDTVGNVYGVCRGSGYSFSKEYYAHDLPWRFNDTHGIGIVMLAGIEVEKMCEASL